MALRRVVAVVAIALVPLVMTQFASAGQGLTVASGEADAPPLIRVEGGSPRQHQRLQRAFDRFNAAGLALPDLDIRFHDDVGTCGGHLGLFRTQGTTSQIEICSEVDFVYEHELAHAWEHANLSDEIRHGFMQLRGFSVWADPTVPRNQRGIEGVAFIIQQGLAGVPLPPDLSAEYRSRLEAFRFLTGRPAPRLLEWIARG